MLKICCFFSHIISFDQNSFLSSCSCAEKTDHMDLAKPLIFQGPEFSYCESEDNFFLPTSQSYILVKLNTVWRCFWKLHHQIQIIRLFRKWVSLSEYFLKGQSDLLKPTFTHHKEMMFNLCTGPTNNKFGDHIKDFKYPVPPLPCIMCVSSDVSLVSFNNISQDKKKK